MKKVLAAVAVAVFFVVATSEANAYAFSLKKQFRYFGKSASKKPSYVSRQVSKSLPPTTPASYLGIVVPQPLKLLPLPDYNKNPQPLKGSSVGSGSVGSVMSTKTVVVTPTPAPQATGSTTVSIPDTWTQKGSDSSETKGEVLKRDADGRPIEIKTTTTGSNGSSVTTSKVINDTPKPAASQANPGPKPQTASAPAPNSGGAVLVFKVSFSTTETTYENGVRVDKITSRDDKGNVLMVEIQKTSSTISENYLIKSKVESTISDANGKVLSVTESVNAYDLNTKEREVTTTTRDGEGKVTKVEKIKEIVPDAMGRPTKIEKATFDANGRVKEIADSTITYGAAEKTILTTYKTYDANGKIAAQTTHTLVSGLSPADRFGPTGNTMMATVSFTNSTAKSPAAATSGVGSFMFSKTVVVTPNPVPQSTGTTAVSVPDVWTQKGSDGSETKGEVLKRDASGRPIEYKTTTIGPNGSSIKTSHVTSVDYDKVIQAKSAAVAASLKAATAKSNNAVGATIMIKAVALPPVGGPQGGIAPDVVNPNQGQAGPAAQTK